MSKAQIVATLGPASQTEEVITEMIQNQMDVARINFAWNTEEDGVRKIKLVRSIAAKFGREIPFIIDLPGPRITLDEGHSYNSSASTEITEKDAEGLRLSKECGAEYIALSFVGNANDIERYRNALKEIGSSSKIIAKIERKVALESLESIIERADAIMIARGDLGSEVGLEEIPFIQRDIIVKAKAARKPVIVATQLLLSMTEQAAPTRAEVSDVADAIMEGADAVMLSEETARGRFPVEVVTMMEKIISEAEKHLPENNINKL